MVLVIDDLHELLDSGALAQLEQLLAPLRLPQLRVGPGNQPPFRRWGCIGHRLAGDLTEVRAADLGVHAR